MRSFVPTFTPGRPRFPTPWSTVLPIPAAPSTPSTPSPADGAVASVTLLSWVAAGATQVTIRLDTVTPPVAEPLPGYYVGTSYVPTLLPSTRYYWQIVAVNAGGTATGPIWSFTTPAATAVLFTLGGVDITARVRWPSLTIHDALHAAPNTASLELLGTSPPLVGQAVAIGLGTLDANNLLFGGTVQDVGQSYIDTPSGFPVWPLMLVDYTFTINKRRPFGTYTNVSATAVALDLIAKSAPGFTGTHVQAGLPLVSITFDGQSDFMTCLGQLATAISTLTDNGVADVDYSQDVHLFLTEPDAVAPDPIDAAHPPLNDPPLAFSTDLSQIRTIIYGKGHGETVPTDVAAGETILPIADAIMFGTIGGGGRAIAGTTSDGAQGQPLTYSGVQLGGGGSLVGPGAQPSTAPSLGLLNTAGLGTGAYGYAYTDVTAAGESLPSPLGSITTVAAFSAPSAPTYNDAFFGGTLIGEYNWACTFVNVLGETTASGRFYNGSSGFFSQELNIPTGPAGTTARRVYRTTGQASAGAASTAQLKFVATVADNTTLTYLDNTADGSLGADVPTVNTSGGFTVTLSGIAIGASPTTSRKVYRTVVDGAQLKLLTTIADNTTTTYADSTPDGSLGANAPIGDDSGLTQPSGQVNAGSASLLTASAGPFQANGGWAILGGGQVVRYTGISGNTLIGIPLSGPGSITTTVLYGSQVLPSPALVGVNAWNGLALPMAKGSAVHLWVQRDDLAAQAALALLERDVNGIPGDGIREYTITDERRGEASLIAVCDADLAIFSRPLVSARFATRAPLKSGQTVVMDLTVGHFDPVTFDASTFDVVTVWGLAGSFVVQGVDLTFDGPALMPRRAVTVSSVQFTLGDLLRKVLIAT